MDEQPAPVDDKYIVFKRDEFTNWLYTVNPGPGIDPVMDAVVIRRQDVFAPPALDTYANGIQIAIEAMLGVGTDNPSPIPGVHRLQDIADYFHRQAAASWQSVRKLPD